MKWHLLHIAIPHGHFPIVIASFYRKDLKESMKWGYYILEDGSKWFEIAGANGMDFKNTYWMKVEEPKRGC